MRRAIIRTRKDDAARDFMARIDVGVVGVDAPIPVPVADRGFGGGGRFNIQ